MTLTHFMLGCSEVQRNGGQLSSGLTSSLQSSRAKPAKQDVKDRESRDEGVDLVFHCKRVPLEALVRRSSPIAVAAKEEEPAEPQVCHCCSRCARAHVCPSPPLLMRPCPPPPPPQLKQTFSEREWNIHSYFGRPANCMESCCEAKCNCKDGLLLPASSSQQCSV